MDNCIDGLLKTIASSRATAEKLDHIVNSLPDGLSLDEQEKVLRAVVSCQVAVVSSLEAMSLMVAPIVHGLHDLAPEVAQTLVELRPAPMPRPRPSLSVVPSPDDIA
jgi:hypothetical protein